jgi:hypothetical protein
VLAPCLERVLRAEGAAGVLYVVPTQALAQDLRRRLEPVRHERLGLRLGLRTGDMKRLAAGTADVLLTTPESLDVMLGSPNREVRGPMRARGYRTLHRLLYPDAGCPGLSPVVAFTPDFFQRLHEEEYDMPPFERNYAEALQHLNVHHLRGLSRAAWHDLGATLITLHAAAYRSGGGKDELACCPQHLRGPQG